MIWFVLGIILVIITIYDLFTGAVWTSRKIYRSAEPGAYWFAMTVYFVLALWCLVPYIMSLYYTY